jgi:hypothetical protein
VKRLFVLLLFVPSVLLAQKDQMPGRGRHPVPERVQRDTGPVPLARSAYSIGIIGYTGGTWQPSGVEFGLLWELNRPTATIAGATLSLGSFVQQQAVLFGQSRGFFISLGGTVRQPLLDLASVGSERNPASLRLEAAADLAGSVNFHSPLPQGRWDGRAALLFGLAFGSSDPLGQDFGLYFGPAAIMGRSTTFQGELALRFRLPLGGR